jgi:hypothetical protein
MRATLVSQRRSRCRAGPSVSLFPFLAVLICTMGALVPLLLAIARQARLQALQEATAKAAQQQVDAQSERELAEWRINELRGSRALAQAQLTKARLALGHVENHARQVRQQAAELRSSLEAMKDASSQGGRRRAELQRELRQVRSDLSRAERQLAGAEQDAKNRPKSYAVIPYEGPHGTYRRPIYIECCADRVILRPEGVGLVESDFEEPLEPDNPLERALRAAREMLLAQKKIKGDGSDEPYPLLLVRPDGIPAYYVAREAMKSWKSEIGYELIGQDWELEFPKPDAEMERAMRGAVAEAREERRQRAILLATLSGGQRRASYRAAPGGGVIQETGTAGPDGLAATPRAAGLSPGTQFGGSAGSMAPAGSGLPDPAGIGAGHGVPGAPGVPGLPAGNGVPSPPGGLALGASAGSAFGAPGGLPLRDDAPGGIVQPEAGSRPAGQASQAVQGGENAGVSNPSGRAPRVTYRAAPGGGLIREEEPGGGAAASGSRSKGALASGSQLAGGNATPGRPAPAAGTQLDGVLPGGPPGATAPAPPAAPGDRQEGARAVALRPGEWIPQDDKPPRKPPNEDELDGKSKGRDAKSKRLADRRGENWGLPNAARGSVGITRPIHVRLFADRLEFLPESGAAAGKVVPLGVRTEDAIDELVSAVWEQMKPWGIGGRGMYWRPILKVEVAPGAETRYAELKSLLDNSGLIMERTSA